MISLFVSRIITLFFKKKLVKFVAHCKLKKKIKNFFFTHLLNKHEVQFHVETE